MGSKKVFYVDKMAFKVVSNFHFRYRKFNFWYFQNRQNYAISVFVCLGPQPTVQLRQQHFEGCDIIIGCGLLHQLTTR